MEKTSPPRIFFNGSSLPTILVGDVANQCLFLLDQFIGALRSVVRHRPDLVMHCTTPIEPVIVSDTDDSFASLTLASSSAARDKWRYIKSKRNMASTADFLPSRELLFREQPLKVFAGLNQQDVLISMSTADEWVEGTLLVEVVELSDEDTGAICQYKFEVPNVSSSAQSDLHRSALKNVGMPELLAGSAIWQTRDSRFPNLFFLPRVKTQLESYDVGSLFLVEIDARLLELDHAVANWNVHTEAFPSWESSVTPESSSRKDKCWFSDEDGLSYCFDLHARFTPGPGRIHFRLDRTGAEKVRIAYVGRKID